MARPPERITVKRRRDEEPVEALYIQQKKYRSSAIWRRVPETRSINQYVTPTIPKVSVSRALLPKPESPNNAQGEHVTDVLAIPPNLQKSELEISSKEIATKSLDAPGDTVGKVPFADGQPVPEPAVPRRFRLSRKISSSALVRSMSKTVIQKPSKRPPPTMCVFVEHASKSVAPERSQLIRTQSMMNILHQNGPEPATAKPRRRPIIGAAEQERKIATSKTSQKIQASQSDAQTADTDADSKQTTVWDPTSEELIKRLYGIALEESQLQADQSQAKPGAPESGAPESMNGSGSSSSIEHAVTTDMIPPFKSNVTPEIVSADDYVYDTYVRSQEDADESTILEKVVPNLAVGILVIEDDEESAFWDLENAEDSDDQKDSDEDDENAEDYYGNDYPEDEIDSDDEQGLNAYNYRTSHSSDEEY